LSSTCKHSLTLLSKQQATEHQTKWVALIFYILGHPWFKCQPRDQLYWGFQ